LKRILQFFRFTPLVAALLLVHSTGVAQTYWMQHAGGLTIDEAMDVSLDGAGNSYITGYFTTTATFGSNAISSSGIDDVFLAKLGANGLYLWSVAAGGANSDRALSIKTDNAGNSFITGYFYGTATFGSQSVTAVGAQDVFIAKYDNAGVCLWAKSAGGLGADIGNGITIDNLGNVIVTGEFAGAATFGSTALNSLNGTTDVFTTKLDGNGNFLWSKKGSASQTDRGLDVVCDASGGIYITGQYSDTITFDVVHLNSMLNAVFVVKYDAAGNEQWFRTAGGGAMNIANSIASDGAGGVYITGDYQGTITFFGATNVSLSATYSNGIFIAKYDAGGNLLWDVGESSDSPLTSRSISAVGPDCFIAGNFKCTFDSYQDRHTPSNFNSSGYWDIFTGKYTAGSGAWVRSHHIGGSQDQICNGVAGDASGNPHIAGSYLWSIVTPVSPAFYGYPSFLQYNMALTTNAPPNGSLCSDQNYAVFTMTQSAGNSDIFVACPLDPNRSLYDFYYNTSCAQPDPGVCINQYNGIDYNCGPDTIEGCNLVNLYGATQTALLATSSSPYHVGPIYNYLWSTGQTSESITVGVTGDYSVVITSQDGCYSSEDTIHFILHTPPPIPVISDNVVINTNSASPQDIVFCGDSVLLVGGYFASTSTVSWTGPQFNPGSLANDSAMIDTSGQYVFTVTDIFGCTSTNVIQVTLDDPLAAFDPELICMNDTDRNDSIIICENTPVIFFPYDSISNPQGGLECIEDLLQILWTVSPSSTANILPYTDCVNFAFQQTTMLVSQTGWYTVGGVFIRVSACGADTIIFSDSIYVEVLPVPPPIIFNLQIIGDTSACPGDSNMFVVTGGYNYVWSTGSTNDTVYFSQAGIYSVVCSDTTYNSYGCFSASAASASVQLTLTPQPVITLYPSTGVICPGDSVLAVVSGAGTFVWQGPNGPIGGDVDSIWITSPGTYYCVSTSIDSCQLLSNSVIIQQYNTPLIQASPAAVICPGDSVTLSLVASNGSFAAWLPPLSGSALTQVVTSPGTYGVSVAGCNIITTAYITIVPTSVVALITPLSTLTVCEGDSILLGANAGMDDYNWQPGNLTDSIVYVFTDGNYVLTTQDSGGCEAHDTIAIAFVQNTLQAPVVSDTTVCRGMPFGLNANGASTLTWYGLNGNPLGTGSELLFPIGLQVDSSFLVLTDDGICRSSLSPVNVNVEECPPLTPNVFSPNGDGVNDVFMLYEPEALNIHVWIYDRWGVLIYEYTDVYGFWDGTYQTTGKLCVDGVYYWIADIGYTNSNAKKSGFVHLLINAD